MAAVRHKVFEQDGGGGGGETAPTTPRMGRPLVDHWSFFLLLVSQSLRDGVDHRPEFYRIEIRLIFGSLAELPPPLKRHWHQHVHTQNSSSDPVGKTGQCRTLSFPCGLSKAPHTLPAGWRALSRSPVPLSPAGLRPNSSLSRPLLRRRFRPSSAAEPGQAYPYKVRDRVAGGSRNRTLP
jgi:hypothetical protein